MFPDMRPRRFLLPRLGIRTAAVIGAVVVASVGAGAGLPVPAHADPPMPQVDPFYQPPEEFAAAEPGTILRSRPVQLPFLPVPAQSWQLLYRNHRSVRPARRHGHHGDPARRRPTGSPVGVTPALRGQFRPAVRAVL